MENASEVKAYGSGNYECNFLIVYLVQMPKDQWLNKKNCPAYAVKARIEVKLYSNIIFMFTDESLYQMHLKYQKFWLLTYLYMAISNDYCLAISHSK